MSKEFATLEGEIVQARKKLKEAQSAFDSKDWVYFKEKVDSLSRIAFRIYLMSDPDNQ